MDEDPHLRTILLGTWWCYCPLRLPGALALSTMFQVPELLGVSDTAALRISVRAIGLIGSVYAILWFESGGGIGHLTQLAC